MTHLAPQIQKKIKKLIYDASIVVSSRLHPIVFALSERTRIIPIKTNNEPYSSVYERKFSGILKIFGLSGDEWISENDVSKINIKSNVGRFTHMANESKIDEAFKSRKKQISRMVKRIKRGND
jgi:polysaccharide pyruvyl transferase WcaK-like protein